ncbi:MAG: hypothetical protein GY722_19550 [bacterium]|nr:hypothetical protein [bacterium]
MIIDQDPPSPLNAPAPLLPADRITVRYHLVGHRAFISVDVARDSLEWRRMWKVIRERFGDIACLSDRSGEVWQYMGTYRVDRHAGLQLLETVKANPARGRWEHQFRHRDLSETGRRCYFKFRPSQSFLCDLATGRVEDLNS